MSTKHAIFTKLMRKKDSPEELLLPTSYAKINQHGINIHCQHSTIYYWSAYKTSDLVFKRVFFVQNFVTTAIFLKSEIRLAFAQRRLRIRARMG